MNKKIKKISSLIGFGAISATIPLTIASCSKSENDFIESDTLNISNIATEITPGNGETLLGTITINDPSDNAEYNIECNNSDTFILVSNNDNTWNLSYDENKIVEGSYNLTFSLTKNQVLVDEQKLKIIVNPTFYTQTTIKTVNLEGATTTYVIPFSSKNVDQFCLISNRSLISFWDKNNELKQIVKKDIVSLVFGEDWKVGLANEGYELDGEKKYNYLPNDFLSHMFYNSEKSEIKINLFGLENITEVGNNFAKNMFYECTNLTSLSEDFNLPQKITSVGSSFCYQMFLNCSSISSLPTKFNLPKGITDAKNNFASIMFGDCSSLISLPEGFNLPQEIKLVEDYFAGNMFDGCSSLISLPDGFNLPQGISGSVGWWFSQGMFNGCSGLSFLPNGFNIPSKITNAKSHFCRQMFKDCSNLYSPKDYITTINIPNIKASDYCSDMFFGVPSTDVVTPLPNTFVELSRAQ